MGGKAKKKLLDQLKQMVEEEAINAEVLYDVEYEYHSYSGDIQTLYVFEKLTSPNPVEFHMLDVIVEKLKAMNPRFQVGIISEEAPPLEDE